MRYLLLAFCLAAWSAPSLSASIDRVDVTAYGLASGSQGVREGTSSNGIEHWRTDDIKVVAATTRIPACLGIRFGIVFSTVGAFDGTPVTIRQIYRFPRSGLHRPGLSSPIYDSYFDRGLTPGMTYGLWYQFDHPWEIVPGDWTFEVRDGDRVLASKTFAVVAPKPAECQGLSV
jgi:hypothetical protein